MGISTLTAMIISNREDLIFSHAKDTDTGKFAGWIRLPPYHRPLLNTEAIFDTAEDAETHMRELKEKLKESK